MILTCKCGNKKMIVTQTKECDGCSADMCYYAEDGQCDWLNKECDGDNLECSSFRSGVKKNQVCTQGLAMGSGCTMYECSECGVTVKRRIEAYEE